MTTIELVNGALDGRRHVVHGRFPDVIELPWQHSSSRHIYELVCVKVGQMHRIRYWHVKSYRPATQDACGK